MSLEKLDKLKDYFTNMVSEQSWGYVWEDEDGDETDIEEEKVCLRITTFFLRSFCKELKSSIVLNEYIIIEDQDGEKFVVDIDNEVGDNSYFWLDNIKELNRDNYKKVMDFMKVQEDVINMAKEALYNKEFDDLYQLDNMFSPSGAK